MFPISWWWPIILGGIIELNGFVAMLTDVVTEFIEGLVETYPGLQYLDGFPEVITYINYVLIYSSKIFLHTYFLVSTIFCIPNYRWRLYYVLMFQVQRMTKLRLYQVWYLWKFRFYTVGGIMIQQVIDWQVINSYICFVCVMRVISCVPFQA